MVSPALPVLPAASRLGGYEILGLVGRGGMGEVYRAKQLSMEREVALKVLSPRLAKQNPAFAEQFVAEARAAGKLNHPNIVGVHDVGQAPAPTGCPNSSGLAAGEAVHYFSMEFIEGETLKDVIERQGAVDLATVGRVMAAMAEALAFAEAHKIVHRDIKPDNIMLTSAGTVKLADLGLALQSDSAEAIAGSKDEQGRGKVMGTPLYMAPEQARAHPLDHRADQYALGSTLFHMLTGRPPFQGDSSRAIMRAHCFEPVPDPLEVNPEVPPPWGELCMRMMAKAPDERFVDASTLRVAIKQAVRWMPATATRGHETRSKQPWIAIAVTAVIALGLLALVVLRTPSPPPSVVAPKPAVGPSSPDPSGAARAFAIRALSTLPEEPTEAIRTVERLLTDPGLAPARDLLQAQLAKLRAAVEERGRNSLRAAADALEGLITSGQLGEARDSLARLPDEPWLADRRQRLKERLSAAELACEARFGGAIATANTAACAKLADEIAHSGLPEARRSALDAKLEQRRSALAAHAAKMAKTDSAVLWRQLGEQCEPLRSTLPYSALADGFRSRSRAFPEADRAQVEQLVTLVELAQQAEAALRLHIGQTTPKIECRFGHRSDTFVLTRLEKDWIFFRLVDVPAETRAERGTAVVPWDRLLATALAGQPEGPRLAASFLWFWDQGEARAALAKLKDDPLVAAVNTYERRTVPLDIVGEIERGGGGQLSIAYPFTDAKAQAYLPAWPGPGVEISARGLRWTTTARVDATSKTEADLPTLRWAAALRAPATLETTLQPEPGSEVVLVGLSSGELTIRIGLNPKGKGFILATKAGGDIYEVISSGLPPEFSLTGTSRLRLTVDAAGKVVAALNDKPLISDRPLAFPPDAKLVPVIQARAFKQGAGVTISSLTFSGKP